MGGCLRMLRALRWLRGWADKSHPNLIEIGICMVGVEWVSQFEVFAHFKMATDGGVSDVRSIAALLLSPAPPIHMSFCGRSGCGTGAATPLQSLSGLVLPT